MAQWQLGRQYPWVLLASRPSATIETISSVSEAGDTGEFTQPFCYPFTSLEKEGTDLCNTVCPTGDKKTLIGYDRYCCQ